MRVCRMCNPLFGKKVKEKTLIEKIKSSFRFREWQFNVMRSCEYCCQNCGKKGVRKAFSFLNFPVLYTIHKNPIDDVIERNKITNEAEALQCEELWDVQNGVSLCIKCYYDKRYPDRKIRKKRSVYRVLKVRKKRQWKVVKKEDRSIIEIFNQKVKAIRFKKELDGNQRKV